MENEFKQGLKFEGSWDSFSQEQSRDLLLKTLETEFAKNNKIADSPEAKQYFQMMISAIMIEHHKYFQNYGIEINYRFKTPKSITDKILDYMSRNDASDLKSNDEKTQYSISIKDIQDVMAMKIVLQTRPSTYHSNDSELSNLIDEKIKNQDFLGKMQEFQTNLLEDEFSISPKYLYKVSKLEYYTKCKEIIRQIFPTISPNATNLIDHYKKLDSSIDETLAIIHDSSDEDTIIDEDDFPYGDINFMKLLEEFSSRIYDKLDLEVLTRQMNSIFNNSELLNNLHITFNGIKEKRARSRICF